MHKIDFERLLAAPARARSAHFACHHAAGRPAAPAYRRSRAVAAELSTADAPVVTVPVDDCPPEATAAAGQWAGCVIPKRHARRAVTRNLLKRQIRAAFDRHASRLPAGLWVVRLKAPFAPGQFPSAASAALRAAARAELDTLLARAGG